LENKKNIQISDVDTGQVEKEITTDGYLVFYLEGERLKATADFSLKSVAPFLMKTLAEKFSKGL